MEGIQIITGDFVNVQITTSAAENGPPVERRFKKGITVADFKSKLELVTGASPATMKLEVYDNNNKIVCNIDNDNALLGSYPIDDGFRIHVVDNFSLTQDFLSSDTSERFTLTEDAYEKKQDTVRAFLQKNRLGKYNEEETKQRLEQQKAETAEEERLASMIKIGSRCEVRVPKHPVRRATVLYNGKLEGKNGIFIGVKYDEPLGQNDGSFDGKRYFECLPKYGGFVKPMYVTVGDFPVEDFDLEDEI